MLSFQAMVPTADGPDIYLSINLAIYIYSLASGRLIGIAKYETVITKYIFLTDIILSNIMCRSCLIQYPIIFIYVCLKDKGKVYSIRWVLIFRIAQLTDGWIGFFTILFFN